jgi:hypothetical protein
MVSAAAHDGDTEGAAKAGLRTATVARPDEFGPKCFLNAEGARRYHRQGFERLADKLRA